MEINVTIEMVQLIVLAVAALIALLIIFLLRDTSKYIYKRTKCRVRTHGL